MQLEQRIADLECKQAELERALQFAWDAIAELREHTQLPIDIPMPGNEGIDQ